MTSKHENDHLKRKVSQELLLHAKNKQVGLGEWEFSQVGLETFGLATCTGLGIVFSNGTVFLAHIEAFTSQEIVTAEILEYCKQNPQARIVKILIWKPVHIREEKSVSLRKVRAIITAIETTPNIALATTEVESIEVTVFDIVGFDKMGTHFKSSIPKSDFS